MSSALLAVSREEIRDVIVRNQSPMQWKIWLCFFLSDLFWKDTLPCLIVLPISYPGKNKSAANPCFLLPPGWGRRNLCSLGRERGHIEKPHQAVVYQQLYSEIFPQKSTFPHIVSITRRDHKGFPKSLYESHSSERAPHVWSEHIKIPKRWKKMPKNKTGRKSQQLIS